MNRKGFTLIEVLATLTIVGVIAALASINIIKLFDIKEKVESDDREKVITEAACLYIELEKNQELKEVCLLKGCEVKAQELIDNELINEEDVDKNTVINIYKEDNQKKCVIKE